MRHDVILTRQIAKLTQQLERAKALSHDDEEVKTMELILSGLNAALDNLLKNLPTNDIIESDGELAARWEILKSYHGRHVVVKNYGAVTMKLLNEQLANDVMGRFPSCFSVSGTLEVNEARYQARVVSGIESYCYFDIADFMLSAEETPESRMSDGLPVFLLSIK